MLLCAIDTAYLESKGTDKGESVHVVVREQHVKLMGTLRNEGKDPTSKTHEIKWTSIKSNQVWIAKPYSRRPRSARDRGGDLFFEQATTRSLFEGRVRKTDLAGTRTVQKAVDQAAVWLVGFRRYDLHQMKLVAPIHVRAELDVMGLSTLVAPSCTPQVSYLAAICIVVFCLPYPVVWP